MSEYLGEREEDEEKKPTPEIKLTVKVTKVAINSQYNVGIPLVDLFALFSEARAQAAKYGWETAILDPIEEILRKIKQ